MGPLKLITTLAILASTAMASTHFSHIPANTTTILTSTATTIVTVAPTAVVSTFSSVAVNGSMSIEPSSVLFGSSSRSEGDTSVVTKSTVVGTVSSGTMSMSHGLNSTVTVTKTPVGTSSMPSATTSAGPQNGGGRIEGGWVVAGVVGVLGMFV